MLLGTPALLAVRHGTFGELLDGRLAERVEVGGFAACDEALLDDDLLVDPRAAGVADIGAQAWPRRHRPAPDHVRLDQYPGSMADRGDGFAGVEERLHEGHSLGPRAGEVGVGDATGQH